MNRTLEKNTIAEERLRAALEKVWALGSLHESRDGPGPLGFQHSSCDGAAATPALSRINGPIVYCRCGSWKHIAYSQLDDCQKALDEYFDAIAAAKPKP